MKKEFSVFNLQRKMNRRIVSHLEGLRQRYDEEGDENRERAYRRAIESILEYDQQIYSGDQAMQLQGIGTGIAWRIDNALGITGEITPPPHPPLPAAVPSGHAKAKTKRAPRAKEKATRSKRNTKNNDLVPPLVHHKINFLQDGSSNSNSRSRSERPARPQRTSREQVQRAPEQTPKTRATKKTQVLKNNLRCPRENADKLLDAIRSCCTDSEMHIALAGDYRRSWDEIDKIIILVTERNQPRSSSRSQRFIENICNQLQTSGLLSDVCLGAYHGATNVITTGKLKFKSGHICECLLIAVAATEWPFMLMKYTGSTRFWQQMQQTAMSQGLRLTERGLMENAQSEVCRTEREIFARLRMPYIPPENR